MSDKHPDLCRRVESSHPLSQPVNTFFKGLETQFRHLSENVIQVLEGGKKLSQSVNQLTDQVKTQEQNSNRINSETGTFSDSFSTMLENTTETADIADEAAKSVENGNDELKILLNHIESIGTNMDRTWQEMNGLETVSSSINELTSVIKDTAERLHLISINAAIEASRSGNGGFKVIAGEIQNMAAETSESVNRVETMVGDIRDRVGLVGEALSSSQKSTKICLEKSGQVRDVFSSIHDLTARLDRETRNIKDELHQRSEGIELINQSSEMISSAGAAILNESERIESQSTLLINVVNSVIQEIGSYRLSWHKQIRSQCEAGAESFKAEQRKTREELDTFLKGFLESYQGFELAYIMDEHGRQVSSNVQQDDEGLISFREGFGINRADKEYFINPRKSNSSFLTDIYLSTATGDLCITVSVPVNAHGQDFVIAADVNLKGLLEAV